MTHFIRPQINTLADRAHIAHIRDMSPNPAFAALPDRALVRVGGEQTRGFLQGLVTQDVEALAAGEVRYGALLTPQGRMLLDLFFIGEEDAVLLDVNAAARADLIQRLTLYRLRAKVTIEPVDGVIHALWNTHAVGPEWASDPRLPALGWRAYGSVQPPACEPGDYDAHRLAYGVVDPAQDAPAGDLYPLEANLDLLNGIAFQKGCFVGQETTSRMKRRGIIKSRVVPIAFDGAPPAFGAEVLSGDLRAGEVRSAREGRALALMRLDRAESAALTVEGRPVRLDPPVWMEPSVAIKSTGTG